MIDLALDFFYSMQQGFSDTHTDTQLDIYFVDGFQNLEKLNFLTLESTINCFALLSCSQMNTHFNAQYIII